MPLVRQIPYGRYGTRQKIPTRQGALGGVFRETYSVQHRCIFGLGEGSRSEIVLKMFRQPTLKCTSNTSEDILFAAFPFTPTKHVRQCKPASTRRPDRIRSIPIHPLTSSSDHICGSIRPHDNCAHIPAHQEEDMVFHTTCGWRPM